MGILLGHDSSCVCYRLYYGMVWNHSVTTKTACVRTAHTLHLNLKVCVARSGRVGGVATHAFGGNVLLLLDVIGHLNGKGNSIVIIEYNFDVIKTAD